MYFKRIDMQGFKSFAELVSVEFSNGVTCIVGPNGSGKSNISDAIRWVLGEQSPKALRGGKMDEVIFAGTASRKSRGMAEVTVVIDNTTGILPIDYSEVAITRRMYRSGESEYLINNNHCRLKDIRELIMDTGIGVDGYSIIGQGKIADLVSNKAESRREIFEEAAGIVMYRTKKAEAEKKLAASNANLERINDIVSEIEGRIGGLKDDSEKAQIYLELRERFKELEVNITLKNIENIELKSEYLKDDLAETDRAIAELKSEKEKTDEEVNHARQRNENLEELSLDANKKLIESISAINDLAGKFRIDQERIVAIDNNQKRLSEEIAALMEKLQKEEENAAEMLKNKSEIDGELARLDAVLTARVEKYRNLTDNLAERMLAIDEKKNTIFELHSTATAKETEAMGLEGLADSLKNRREQILSDRAVTVESKANAGEAAHEGLGIKAKLEDDIKNLKQEVQTYKNQGEAFVTEQKELSSAIENSRIVVGQLSSRKKTIEEMEANYEGYNHAVKFIMNQGVKGLYGVVAELIDVPAGYETAIETALGAAMQNIICDTDSSAKEAVEILKQTKAGRLTFLPVASVKGGFKSDAKIMSATGFKGYGVDCITFDPKYKNIFEYLLGRVVIVDKLDNAIKLSKSGAFGLRFVTLEGEVINSSGAITGGKYKNKTANLLERKAEIARLTEEISQKEEQREGYVAKLKQVTEQIAKVEISYTQCADKLRQTEMELYASAGRYERLLETIGDCESNIQKHDRELASIENESAEAGQMSRKLRDEATLAKENIKKFEKEIESELCEYEAKKAGVETINEEITRARMEVSSCTEQKNSVDAIVFRINNAIDEVRADIGSKEAQIKVLRDQRTEITSGEADTEGLLGSKEEEKRNLEGYIAEINDEKSSVLATLKESSAHKEEIDEKMTALQNSKYEMDIKQAKYETQLSNYKDKLWEDFEISYVQAMEFRKKDFSMNSAVKESRELKNQIRELGEVNIGAIKEYAAVSERYEFLTAQRADVLSATEILENIIADMDKTIKAKFKESFEEVMDHFGNIFKELFGGGYAELKLDDENNPLESGIEIVAQPPGKKLQNINLLSGGEKTMTAIALMFALLKTKPTPFCIFDEVEAALDDANINRVVNYLKNFNDVQFALITHQRATMEHADVLYGVTMPEHGISKILSLKLEDDFDLDGTTGN